MLLPATSVSCWLFLFCLLSQEEYSGPSLLYSPLYLRLSVTSCHLAAPICFCVKGSDQVKHKHWSKSLCHMGVIVNSDLSLTVYSWLGFLPVLCLFALPVMPQKNNLRVGLLVCQCRVATNPGISLSTAHNIKRFRQWMILSNMIRNMMHQIQNGINRINIVSSLTTLGYELCFLFYSFRIQLEQTDCISHILEWKP